MRNKLEVNSRKFSSLIPQMGQVGSCWFAETTVKAYQVERQDMLSALDVFKVYHVIN